MQFFWNQGAKMWGKTNQARKIITTGGGILLFAILVAIPPHLYAKELRAICTTPDICRISNPADSPITNHGDFVIKSKIELQTTIATFINYGSITTYNNGTLQDYSFLMQSGTIRTLINYGHISSGITTNSSTPLTITNYGVMGGVYYQKTPDFNITINNRGVINLVKHENDNKKVILMVCI